MRAMAIVTVMALTIVPAGAAEDAALDLPADPMEGFGYAAYRDSAGHGEDYWVKEVTSARERVRLLENELARLDGNGAVLRREWTSVDDPAQRIQIKKAWDLVLQRRETTVKQLAAARLGVEGLYDRARRAGALPGWLRAAEEARTGGKEAPPAAPGVTFRVDLTKLAREHAAADERLGRTPRSREDGQDAK